jgi:hypothetical protein
MDRLLPRLQLVFIVIFAVISVCGPLIFAQGNLVILAAALSGILVGGCTFLIGWRMQVAKSSVTYPFPELSFGIIKLFLKPKQSRGLKPFSRKLSPLARRVLGIANLVIGGLLVVGLMVVSILVIMS